MEKKYDIGILGVWSGCNYGSIATYYALNQIITSMGKSVLMIDKPILSSRDIERQFTHSRRFAEEYYNISEQYPIDDVAKLNDICDGFVIGSDQIWNYGISKNFKKLFYLDFAEDDKKKVAYGTSFGHGIDFAPPEERKKISALMNRFDGISLREADGVTICEKDYGVKATHVLDPVFLADPSVYTPLIEKSKFKEEEPFLATYILDPTPEKTAAILHLSKELGGIKIVNMLDGLPWLFNENVEKTNLPNCIENLEVEEWLYYISKCKFLITDSCHGASFGIIFKKNFIAITNKRRGFSRFKSLSELFKFEDHLVEDVQTILTNKTLLEPINYEVIDEIMDRERKRCQKWLEDVLEKKKSENLPKKMCVGCGSCVSACPKNALTLKPDEMGYYRATLDRDLCINCGLCVKSCPAISLPNKNNATEPECYSVIASDKDLLKKSSSGGIFSLLANKILEENGVIVGAAWKDDFSVEHIIIDSEEKLEKLRKSKYMQSYMGNIFREIKTILNSNRKVLFSGCPCQVAGLKKYLVKEYDNLITLDLLCGNSPSAGFFQKYLEESFPEGIKEYEFRCKNQGWNSDCVDITLKNGEKLIRRGAKEDLYQKVYHSHIMCAPHCQECKYQSLPRFGDLTIGDFWGYSKRDSSVDVTKGVSAVLCNSEKGTNLFNSIPSDLFSFKKSVPLNWIGGNGYALAGKHNWISPKRDKFYELMQTKTFTESVKKVFEEPVKVENKPISGFSPLQYDSQQLHFKFDSNVWEEHFINGKTTLITKQVKPETGKMAVIPFREALKIGQTYTFKIRFKANSKSKAINLHMLNSIEPKKHLQIVHACKSEKGFDNEWIEIEKTFVAKSNLFDGFGIGAAQFTGELAYFIVDYISVK